VEITPVLEIAMFSLKDFVAQEVIKATKEIKEIKAQLV
jgi:hypothetical protein